MYVSVDGEHTHITAGVWRPEDSFFSGVSSNCASKQGVSCHFSCYFALSGWTVCKLALQASAPVPASCLPGEVLGIMGLNSCIQLLKCKCRLKIKLRSSGLHGKRLYLLSRLLFSIFNDNLNQIKNIFPGNQIIKTTKEVTTSKGPHACTHRG